MVIIARSMASGRQVGMLPGTVAETSHLGYNHEARAHPPPTHTWKGVGWEWWGAFWNLKTCTWCLISPNKTKPTNPPQKFPPSEDQVFKCKMIYRPFSFKPPQELDLRGCSQSMWGFTFCGRQHFLDTAAGRCRMFPLPLLLLRAEVIFHHDRRLTAARPSM